MVKFEWNEKCLKEFKCLKVKLVESPNMIIPNWPKHLEIICDVRGVSIGAVLGQKKKKLFHPIYYSSKTLNGAQKNYIVTK